MSWDQSDPHDEGENQEGKQEQPERETGETPAVPPQPPQGQPSGRPGFAQKQQNGKPKGKSVVKGCLVALIALVGVAFLLMVSFTLILFASLMGGIAGVGGPGTQVTMVNGVTVTQRTVSGKEGDMKIAVLPVQGMLVRGEYTDPVRLLDAMLTLAERDEKMAGIIIEVDSGGGSVHAADLMYQSIAKFKERTKLPVVVLMGSVAASGGYYVSCAADRLVAHRTTITGSIGVLLPLYDVTGLMDKIGVED